MAGNFVANNLSIIEKRISKISSKNNSRNDRVLILAVSKKQSIETIKMAYEAGLQAFGENYVQELLEKQSQLGNLDIEWHFIGHLQKNKIKKIVGRVSLIHSIDDFEMAKEISERAVLLGVQQRILIQVNIAKEVSKGGVLEENLMNFVERLLPLKGLDLCGLMTMPPLDFEGESSGLVFKSCCEWRNKIRKKFNELKNFDELSMGTSHDYESAVINGATIIRLGTSLLGSRGA
ncbi:MAG: YggS family pyridoxal phosphate-dependent enzyme [Bdellovibrionales bacterium]|nr:YggS family pyridoxal phosphate-dependent enzyme [Bdellovibrionales bacterium]